MDRVISDEISWAPSRAVFLRRVLVAAVITFVSLATVALVFSLYFGLPITWGFLVALTLTTGFAVEDLMHWRNAKSDRWRISDGHLIHDGAEGRAQIPLSDIANVWTQFGSRVIVKLTSGQRIAIRYLAYPVSTAEQLNAARVPDVMRDAK